MEIVHPVLNVESEKQICLAEINLVPQFVVERQDNDVIRRLIEFLMVRKAWALHFRGSLGRVAMEDVFQAH